MSWPPSDSILCHLKSWNGQGVKYVSLFGQYIHMTKSDDASMLNFAPMFRVIENVTPHTTPQSMGTM